MSPYCDMAIAILGRSQDGNLLTPRDLKLTELAVNGFLNEAGDVAFTALHAQVMDGRYFDTPHWLHGIEHLSIDHSGYVYWKGRVVDHYSFTDKEREKAAAHALAERCRRLENVGIPVSGRTVLCEACLQAPADTPWKLALQRYYAFFEDDAGRVVGIFYRLVPPGTDDQSVCSVQTLDGRVHVSEHPGAYEAFHALREQGLTSMGSHPGYDELVSRLTRQGVCPETLEAVLRGERPH